MLESASFLPTWSVQHGQRSTVMVLCPWWAFCSLATARLLGGTFLDGQGIPLVFITTGGFTWACRAKSIHYPDVAITVHVCVFLPHYTPWLWDWKWRSFMESSVFTIDTSYCSWKMDQEFLPKLLDFGEPGSPSSRRTQWSLCAVILTCCQPNPLINVCPWSSEPETMVHAETLYHSPPSNKMFIS